MQRSAGHLSARAVRLLKKYFCDVLYVGSCIAFLGGVSQRSDGSGDLSSVDCEIDSLALWRPWWGVVVFLRQLLWVRIT